MEVDGVDASFRISNDPKKTDRVVMVGFRDGVLGCGDFQTKKAVLGGKQ